MFSKVIKTFLPEKHESSSYSSVLAIFSIVGAFLLFLFFFLILNLIWGVDSFLTVVLYTIHGIYPKIFMILMLL